MAKPCSGDWEFNFEKDMIPILIELTFQWDDKQTDKTNMMNTSNIIIL